MADMMFFFEGDQPSKEQELAALNYISDLVLTTTAIVENVVRAAEISELEAMWKR